MFGFQSFDLRTWAEYGLTRHIVQPKKPVQKEEKHDPRVLKTRSSSKWTLNGVVSAIAFSTLILAGANEASASAQLVPGQEFSIAALQEKMHFSGHSAIAKSNVIAEQVGSSEVKGDQVASHPALEFLQSLRSDASNRLASLENAEVSTVDPEFLALAMQALAAAEQRGSSIPSGWAAGLVKGTV